MRLVDAPLPFLLSTLALAHLHAGAQPHALAARHAELARKAGMGELNDLVARQNTDGSSSDGKFLGGLLGSSSDEESSTTAISTTTRGVVVASSSITSASPSITSVIASISPSTVDVITSSSASSVVGLPSLVSSTSIISSSTASAAVASSSSSASSSSASAAGVSTSASSNPTSVAASSTAPASVVDSVAVTTMTTDAAGSVQVVTKIVTGAAAAASDQAARQSASAPSSDDSGGGGISTGAIIGISVAAGVVVLSLIGCAIWRMKRRGGDEDEAIRWPELNRHGDSDVHHALPARQTGQHGIETGLERSVSNSSSIFAPSTHAPPSAHSAAPMALNGSSFGAASSLEDHYYQDQNAPALPPLPGQHATSRYDGEDDYTNMPPALQAQQPGVSAYGGYEYDSEEEVHRRPSNGSITGQMSMAPGAPVTYGYGHGH